MKRFSATEILLNNQLLTASGGIIYLNGAIPLGDAYVKIDDDQTIYGTKSIVGNLNFPAGTESKFLFESTGNYLGSNGSFSQNGVEIFSPFSRSANGNDNQDSIHWGYRRLFGEWTAKNGLKVEGTYGVNDENTTTYFDVSPASRNITMVLPESDGDGSQSVLIFDGSSQQFFTRYNGSLSIDWGTRRLADNSSTTTLDWGNRYLYGQWQITGTPTLAGDIINKAYLDSRLASASYSGFVRTTGNQTISGNKSFVGVFSVNGEIHLSRSVGSSILSIFNDGGLYIYDEAGVQSFNGERNLYDEAGEIALKWSDKMLYGNWSIDGTPSSPNHLINKAFFDSRTGLILNSTVVRTTGAQTIIGAKTFSAIATDRLNLGIFSYFNQSGDLRNSGNSLLMSPTNYALYGAAETLTLNWNNRQLSGNWSTNTSPTLDSHILNKGYLDTEKSYGGSLLDGNKIAKFSNNGKLDIKAWQIPDLSHSIDSKIYGKSGTTGEKNIFSTKTHGTSTYIRNTGCWAYDIDLTPISVWNSNGEDVRAGTLISPRHVILANHYSVPNGTTMRWVDRSNNVVTRTVSNQIQIGSSDIQILLLDSDVPSNISFCKVVDSSFSQKFKLNEIPLLYTDQEEKALVAESSINSGESFSIYSGTKNYRGNFYETVVGGDSGNPVGFVVGNEIYLATTFFHSEDGPNFGYYNSLINSGMNALGGGYSATPPPKDLYPISPNFPLDKLGSAAYKASSFNPTNGQIPLVDANGKLNIDIIPSGVVFVTGGLFDPTIVRTTGIQNISGQKTFKESIIISNASVYVNGANGNVSSPSTYCSFYTTYGVGESGPYIGMSSLDGEGVPDAGVLGKYVFDTKTIHLDWLNRTLSGVWTATSLVLGTQTTATGASITLNWASGNVFDKQLHANTTFTFSNAVNGQTITLVLESTGNFTNTFPTGMKWAGGFPYLGTSGSVSSPAYDIYTFMKVNGNIFASCSPNHF